MSKHIKLFQNATQRVDHETNNYIEPYVSLTLNDATYSATIGGVETKEVTPNADGTYTVSIEHGPTITASSTNCLIAYLYEEEEYIEVSSEGVVDGQDTTFTINGTTYYGQWFSNGGIQTWNLYETQDYSGEEVGSVVRVIITEHDNGQLLHYNKTKLATLTLTDGSVVKIEGYFDDTHILGGDLIRQYSETLMEALIHKSVTTIGMSAFSDCTNLKTVTFEDPTKLQSLSNYSFEYCSNLETFGITSNTPLKEIPFRALRGCGFKTVVIPDTVEYIGALAFCDCSSLTEITIPRNVTAIGMQAFQDCTALTSITSLATTPPECTGTDVFVNIPSTCKVYVPAESVSAYKAASQWSAFGNRIQAIQ